jgi:hypothetical protein
MWGPRRLTTLWAKEAEREVKDCKQEMRSCLKLLNSIQSREFNHKHNIVRYISPDIRHEGTVSVMMSSFLILCEYCAYYTRLADDSGRAVEDMKYLRSLKHWDHGFESNWRHGYQSAFLLFVLFYVGSGLATGQITLPSNATNCR